MTQLGQRAVRWRRGGMIGALVLIMILTGAALAITGAQLAEAVHGRARVVMPALTTIEPGGLGPRVEWARYTGVEMFVTDTAEAGTVFVLAAALDLAAVAITGAALILLCVSLMRDRPFGVPVVAIWFMAGASVLSVGVFGPMLRGRGTELVAQSLPVDHPGSLVGRGDVVLYAAQELAVVPLLVGGGLLLVAVALAVALKLRRDADGIV
ncbi:hypothetical protein [Microbacterium sp. SORGH_AS_0888]|uniref:hypothetical protein n=1 Tax=Microbacterium sp. SORGH_AS_0888 TaxID=3041791 RepID=UPI00278611A1|nr:hypothetical protein [Microbacterium sp. SORGH_AS_0888]MDQ1131248.1 hypothetical protein [Microbacterium sp. SORGH_AS_0888]